MSIHTPPSQTVLEKLDLTRAKLTRFESGIINDSWRVEKSNQEIFVLQRVNPIFPATINNDIDAVTQHLQKKGILTPHLVRTPEGKLWLEENNHIWRILTYMPGITRDVLEKPYQAEEASALLARFHLALSDLKLKFSSPRIGTHDTQKHLNALNQALEQHKTHPHYSDVEPLGKKILEIASGLPKLPLCANRLVHGDPKISNFIFDEITNKAICLIDLDTVSTMPIILELGDAIRSWCNTKGEESSDAFLSIPFLKSSMIGYSREAKGLLEEQEWRALPDAILTITIELAARFAADALTESYFSWDPNRYASASEHNQVRAQSQVRLAESIQTQWHSIQNVVLSNVNLV